MSNQKTKRRSRSKPSSRSRSKPKSTPKLVIDPFILSEEYHKGNLFVTQSVKGVGTTFTIRLPKT